MQKTNTESYRRNYRNNRYGTKCRSAHVQLHIFPTSYGTKVDRLFLLSQGIYSFSSYGKNKLFRPRHLHLAPRRFLERASICHQDRRRRNNHLARAGSCQSVSLMKDNYFQYWLLFLPAFAKLIVMKFALEIDQTSDDVARTDGKVIKSSVVGSPVEFRRPKWSTNPMFFRDLPPVHFLHT